MQTLPSAARRSTIRRVVIVTTLALITAGCSSSGSDGPPHVVVPVFPVDGKVVLGDKPAHKALVTFHASNPVAGVPLPQAVVRDDGTFSLTTYETGDGAPAGNYVVTISLRGKKKKTDGTTGKELIEKMPARVLDPTKSDLRVQVKARRQ